ncbi:death-associated inhibitor of apoptosis 1-like, partial [Mercenaria mercenaria]|uniref:death-associated inhibitor of apoptosis 1-like n=1 Tax=Mercenaria mercenaria TaxID=6596 RepID=UPI00234F45E1
MDIHRQLNPNCNFLLRNSEVNVPIRVSESFLQNSTRPTSHQHLQNGNGTDTTSASNTTPLNTLKHSLQTTIQTSSPSSNIFQRTLQNNTGLVSSSAIDTVPSNRMPSRAHGNFVQTVETSSIALERQSHHTTVSSSTFDPSNDGSSTPASQNTTEGANRSSTPKYPKYASKTVRVTSFNDCGDIVIPPDSLADSGFFYAGFGDCVRCFQCGVGKKLKTISHFRFYGRLNSLFRCKDN